MNGCAATQRSRSVDPAETGIARVLDDFHAAAAAADADRYFRHFAPNAVFIGTDASERWTVPEFRRYADERFRRGDGWTYTVAARQVVIDGDRPVAWFHELLDNAKYGRCRGTGTLIRAHGVWRIAQYALTIPVPNEKAAHVVEMIRGG